MQAMFAAVGVVVDAIVQAVTFTLAAVGAFLLIVAFGLATAFVARDYWNWFVSPLGMPPIGLFHAWGLIILVGLLRGTYVANRTDEDDAESIASALAKPLAGLALAWGLGWLIATFAGPF